MEKAKNDNYFLNYYQNFMYFLIFIKNNIGKYINYFFYFLTEIIQFYVYKKSYNLLLYFMLICLFIKKSKKNVFQFIEYGRAFHFMNFIILFFDFIYSIIINIDFDYFTHSANFH